MPFPKFLLGKKQTQLFLLNLFTGRLVLFENNDKKSEKSPDFGGNIEFTLSDAMALTEWITAQEGEENYAGEKVGKIPVSAWNRMSKNGSSFVSGSISVLKGTSAKTVEEMPF